MPNYAIGDLQGCYDELLDLLNEINFDETNDQLWFVGDLINRGKQSLGCLRFVKSLSNARTVLGNHDLHLLAVENGVRKPHRKDTLDEILQAEDKDELLNWLRQQPLLLHEIENNFYILHAGLPPQWSIEFAKELANEAHSLLTGEDFHRFIHNMYGDQPDLWQEDLIGDDKVRFIINCFTRMRFLNNNGCLDMAEKNSPGKQANNLIPWYAHPERKTRNEKIIFGHWSTVLLGNENDFNQYNVFPVDTGCLWGGTLTALRLEDEKIFNVPSRQEKSF